MSNKHITFYDIGTLRYNYTIYDDNQYWNDVLIKACEKGNKELALLAIDKGAVNWNW